MGLRALRDPKRGELPVGFPVFRSKALHLPFNGVGWRGTCNPIVDDENGYRCRISAERDECLSRCFFNGVHH
jgi:hypothetical protein